MIIEFPEYTPDLPPINSPGMTLLQNVVPNGASYTGVKSLVAVTTALTGYVKGFFPARNPDTGDSFNFAGDATKLYSVANDTFSDISKSGGYSLPADEDWQFTQFGDRVIAASIDGDLQSYQFGVSSLFANLSSDATRPYARHISSVGDFVVVGNTYDATDGYVPHRVRWSGINNATVWDVSPVNQSDYQDLDAANGWVNGVIGGAYGTIFQERAITTMHYVGSPAIFEFKQVLKNNGTLYPRAFAKVGNLIYFIGLDGFYVFDGYQAVPIGINKVDKTFLDDVNTSYRHRVTTAIDYNRQIIVWSYPDSNTDNVGTPTKVLYYNYAPNATKRWGTATFDHQAVVNYYVDGYLMDAADGADDNADANTLGYWQINVQSPPVNPPDLDQLPFSLDSKVWTGNDFVLGAFDTSNQLASFTGAPLTARLETPEVQINDGKRTQLLRVRPIVDGQYGTRTVQIGYRNLQSETVSYTSAVTVNNGGDYPCRNNARYQRMRLNIAFEGTTANASATPFDHAIGIEVIEQRAAGKR